MTLVSNHLSAEEIVDLIDGELALTRAAHPRSCQGCADRVAEIRRLAGMVNIAPVPEPSPLFWERFSARVASAIRTEPAPRVRGISGLWVRRLLPFAATASIVVALLVGLLPGHALNRARSGGTAAGGSPSIDAARLATLTEDASWGEVADFMENVGAGDAESTLLDPGPGSADEAAMSLSSQEREELVRLLRAELGRASDSSLNP